MKIAIAVHGRFHAFDLARALLARGHDVVVMTDYPAWAVARFGFPRRSVRSFWLDGVLARIVDRVRGLGSVPMVDAFLHESFGRWVRDQLMQERWDVVHSW